MTQERIDLLDQLGFSWEVRPALERPRATWQQRLEELDAFYKKHGHFLVDGTTMPQLHAWCHEQRQRLRLLERNGGKDVSKRMSPARVQALKEKGFTKDTELAELKVPTSAGSGDSKEEGNDGKEEEDDSTSPKESTATAATTVLI